MALAGDLLLAVRATPSDAVHVVGFVIAGLNAGVPASGHRALPALACRLL